MLNVTQKSIHLGFFWSDDVTILTLKFKIQWKYSPNLSTVAYHPRKELKGVFAMRAEITIKSSCFHCIHKQK